jgi:DNA-binding transcriptional LysR family regulator
MVVVHPAHPLAERKEVTVADLSGNPLVLWPREHAETAHDVVLSIFESHEHPDLRVAALYGGAFWHQMQDGAFAVVPLSAAVSGDFATVPLTGTDAQFTMSMLWSRHTPPPLLSGLVEAADAAVAKNNWL